LEEAEGLGYVRLTQFSNGASEKVSEAIEDLLSKGATAIILDLRSNPGGLLSEAVDVGSLFIKEGPIVVEKLKGGEEKVFEAKRPKTLFELPMVVLVNEGSASASEIVAGAIQDTGRAPIVGQQTFGKGSVQLPHHLSDGSELRVTIAEWLTPSGRQIHGEGITPDIVVERSYDEANPEADPQLEEAIEVLSSQNGPRSYQNDSN
jgi:carboxyl-terminal processing protease